MSVPTGPGAHTPPAHRIGGATITFGDSVNTDVIIPGRYLVSIDPTELAEHAFEPLGTEVQQRLRASRIVVAGRNFGCGSAREQAATCLIGAGVTAVVAASFSRVFFRNAINTGLVAVECPEAVDALAAAGGEGEMWVDYDKGTVETAGRTFTFAPYPQGLKEILEDGGLIAHLMRSFEEQKGRRRSTGAPDTTDTTDSSDTTDREGAAR
ncbi:LeuD/DmdB family oxidoreductase small subunit [Streptomyces sp. 8L]|uniref:LeuD/DmdB family oxidoreductase small subunit n=1 Tax=Streptomyces sp. 8L TaxID=2877242 RepID=UPI001CD28B53|nr:3-isopropylmalate dehydratase small subunit [Streptomyces sp. 8L]MCA1218716.1 3-isopropylmalate dehydratase small subunit [Streptomyces sp. 8L]